MKLTSIKIKIRDFIYDFNDKFPNLGKSFLVGWNLIHKIKFKTKKLLLERKGQLKYNSSKFNQVKVLLIDPQKINFYSTNNFFKSSKSSLVLKGDWDLTRKMITESLIYKTLLKRFIDGKDWEEIEYYNIILNEISKGIMNWGFISKKGLDDSLKKIDSKYYQIKNNVKIFKESFKIEKDGELLDKWESFGKIMVAIDRNGEFIVIKEIENLLIAKLLNIPKIPVHIYIRHKAWVDFKKELYYLSTNYRSRKLYHQVTHPDLQNIPFSRGDTRFNIIKENKSISKGTLLDIGANLGYFCCRFEDEGFDCTAVEANRLYAYFLMKLKKAENRKYKIISESIFNYKKSQELCFDIVLALNIFQHFLKRKNTYLNLINLLKRLKVKELFLEPHNPNEFRNIKVYRNYSPEQFVKFIIENSCLTKVKHLITLKNGRSIYKLTDESHYK